MSNFSTTAGRPTHRDEGLPAEARHALLWSAAGTIALRGVE
jgi:hypothetical protein